MTARINEQVHDCVAMHHVTVTGQIRSFTDHYSILQCIEILQCLQLVQVKMFANSPRYKCTNNIGAHSSLPL